MDGKSRSRGWDKEIPHCVLPIEQLVLSDKWARNKYTIAPDKAAYCAFMQFLGPENAMKFISVRTKTQ